MLTNTLKNISWLKMAFGAVTAILVCLFLAINLGGRAEAAEGNKTGIAVSPGNLNVGKLEPGTHKEGHYTLYNIGEDEVTVSVFTESYTRTNGSYDFMYGSESSYTKLSNWVTFEQDKYVLAKDEKVEVYFTIDVPDNIHGGGQYTMIINKAESAGASSDGATAIESIKRIGLALGTVVDGELKESGKLVSLTTRFWQFDSPLTANVSVENDGNVDFDVKSDMTVRNLFGGVKFQVKDVAMNILPESTRDMQLGWEGATFGLYKVQVTTKFLDETKTIEKLVLFLPIWVVIVVITLVAATTGYLLFRRAQRKQRKAKK
jgi:hypothetical protein